jgi:hypothetical protein
MMLRRVCIAIIALVLIVASHAGLADDLLSAEEFTKAFIAKAETSCAAMGGGKRIESSIPSSLAEGRG